MRVLVYPQGLNVGGSQVVAVDFARAMQARGHEVILLSRPGPLGKRAADGGIRVIEDGRLETRAASVESLAALHQAIGQERPDLVHAYEATQCLHALYAAQLAHSVPTLASIMSMRVPWYLPTFLPLVIGTPRKMKDFERRWSPEDISLLPPAVDTNEYQPDLDAKDFVEAHVLDAMCRIALVTRVTVPFKLEGMCRIIEAVSKLSESSSMQLVIVGDGPAMAHIRTLSGQVNERVGRRVVVLTGELSDPIKAYASSHIVVGSGLSILRGMACGKAAIVVGRGGFSKIVGPDTIDNLADRGFYGLGDGGAPTELQQQLVDLMESEDWRRELGVFGRRVVRERFDLADAAGLLESIYEKASARRPSRRVVVADSAATPWRLMRYRRLKSRLKMEVANQGHVGDDADARVHARMADHLASR